MFFQYEETYFCKGKLFLFRTVFEEKEKKTLLDLVQLTVLPAVRVSSAWKKAEGLFSEAHKRPH